MNQFMCDKPVNNIALYHIISYHIRSISRTCFIETGSVDESTEIKHLFHVASTRRVVEAIVTGLVNDLDMGGECMELLAIYSDEHPRECSDG